MLVVTIVIIIAIILVLIWYKQAIDKLSKCHCCLHDALISDAPTPYHGIPYNIR